MKEDAGEEEEGEEEGEEEEGSPGPGHSVTDLTQSPGDFQTRLCSFHHNPSTSNSSQLPTQALWLCMERVARNACSFFMNPSQGKLLVDTFPTWEQG